MISCFYSLWTHAPTHRRYTVENHSQSTIYLFNWSPVSLQCGASCLLKCFYLSTRDWSDLLCLKSTINYWNSVLATTMNMFLKWWISDFRIKLSHFGVENLIFFCFVIDVLILLSILEYSPLANVAHNISPVPVLNCELLWSRAIERKSSVLSWELLGFPVLSFHWKMRAKP